MGSTTIVWVDEKDPRVTFNGTWLTGGTAAEYKATVSSSTRVGDSFVVPFYGNSITVYGTIDTTSGGVAANYSIDGGPPEQAVSQRGSEDTSHQQFWASPALNITQHNLTVTMAKVNPDPEPGEGTIWFDYFIVDDPSGHGGVAPSKGLSKGQIAGIILGCLGFIFIIMSCVVWYIRRRRSKIQAEKRYNKDTGEHGVHDKEIEGVDAQPSRENREWFSGGRQWYSRNGVQPFVLGLSTSSYAGELSQSPSVVYGGGDRKRAMAQNTVAATASPISSSHSGSVASIPTNSGGGQTTTPTAGDGLSPQPPLKARLPRSPTAQNGSEESTGGPGSSTGRQNQALGDESVSIPHLSGINEEERETTGRGPGTHQAPIVDTVRPSLHEDGHGQSGGPTVGIMMANPVNLGDSSGDVVEGSSERNLLRHVDSGLRLLEESRGLVELPPVYSQM